jgi:paraquat-inducible protein A
MSSTLASRYPRIDLVIKALLTVSSFLLVLGIFAPMMTLSKFVWVENEFSLYSGTLQLFKDGQYFLFAIIFVFSIALPLGKLILLFRFWHDDSSTRKQIERFMYWLSHYGKWSMLDVFVVAMLLVIVKLGVLATVEVHYGIYAYASAGILIMIATAIINHVAAEDIAKDIAAAETAPEQ